MKKIYAACLCLTVISNLYSIAYAEPPSKPRARSFGFTFGILPPGAKNSITDVNGVKVGHTTLKKGKSINTGVTAILPHSENLFHNKVPAAIYVENGYGKLAGSTQVNELGEIETPILLTGTLSVPKTADALITYMLSLPNMDKVYSINPVVGETNDGYLSDIRKRPITYKHVKQAIHNANTNQVTMGNVGAGTGCINFGFKGGIGSSSRKLPQSLGGWTVGVLVQTNFGGVLTIDGHKVGQMLNQYPFRNQLNEHHDGSIMIVIATDAPLSHRNLTRLAKRSFLGMARTGGYARNGSGDYAIAFSTHKELRLISANKNSSLKQTVLSNAQMSPVFLAVIEATEEAIIDSLFAADTTIGHRRTIKALPVDQVISLIKTQ